MEGVPWGHAEQFGTPAFWKLQTTLRREAGDFAAHGLGDNLLEEVAACLLGGYGIPAEIGLAAFDALKAAGLLDGEASRDAIHQVLSEPFTIDGTPRRYRFSHQKSVYLAGALLIVRDLQSGYSDLELRSLLLDLPGVGPKTASWIVRNHRNSNCVAILDIHVVRACSSMGVFPEQVELPKAYFDLESVFLEFCARIDEPAAIVDALIWDAMRRIGPTRRPRQVSGRNAQDPTSDTDDLFAVASN